MIYQKVMKGAVREFGRAIADNVHSRRADKQESDDNFPN